MDAEKKTPGLRLAHPAFTSRKYQFGRFIWQLVGVLAT
jgi:hypothetical protein